MARLDLYGGSYEARSVIANAQRCINYFPEVNRKDSPVPFTYYQRPGLRKLTRDVANRAPVRGLYRASNGNGYCVIGQKVYSISPGWVLTHIGTLAAAGTTPVSFIDNGIEIWLVDGSTSGYSIILATNAFSVVVDATGTFTGATRVDYIDTFMIWNVPGTNQFGSTLSNSLSFNALYVAAKTAFPDPLVVPIINRHEIILLGQLKSEIWYNAGNAQFPFALLPGAYIEHGCGAPYSPATADIELFWLSQDLQGDRMILSQKGYDTRRVSNHALEWAMMQMAIVSDAIGFTFQQGGHVYYEIVFPSAGQAWLYDAALGEEPTMAWHQRCWGGPDGLERPRERCAAFMYGTNVVGDYADGTIYALDISRYYDEVGDAEQNIPCVKGFPHIVQGMNNTTGRPELADGRNLQIHQFLLDFQVGEAPLDTAGNPAEVWLRWSRDKGKTFGTEVLQSAGAPGEYMTQPQWATAGLARDFVFEIGHSIRGPAALNSAWIDATILNN